MKRFVCEIQGYQPVVITSPKRSKARGKLARWMGCTSIRGDRPMPAGIGIREIVARKGK